MRKYRRLTELEVARLKAQMCTASDWSKIKVVEDFTPDYIHYARFSGDIRLGRFTSEFEPEFVL